MTAPDSTEDSDDLSTWCVVLLVWLAIAVLTFIVAPNRQDLLADPAQGQHREPGAGRPAAPNASVETPHPDAAIVRVADE
jgi:hypothetical protein